MVTSEDSDSQNDENLSAIKPAAQVIKSKKHKSGKKNAAVVAAYKAATKGDNRAFFSISEMSRHAIPSKQNLKQRLLEH